MGGRMLGAVRDGRDDLVWRFAATSLVLLVGAALGLGWVAGRMIGDYERRLAETESLGVASSAAAAATAMELDVDDLELADLLPLAELIGPELARLGEADLVVWDDTGRILIAIDPALIGTRPAHSAAAVDRVLSTGEPAVEVIAPDGTTHPLGDGRLLETHVPANVAGRTVVLEVAQPYGPVASRITRSQLVVFGALVLTLLALWVVLMPVLTRARRRLRQQNDHLAALLEREQRTVARLRELDRTKSAILTAVSHELRTPLTVVRGMLSTLVRRGDQLIPARRTQLLERAEANAERLQDLLTNLLDVDRLSRGTVEPHRREVEVAPLVQQVAETVGASGRTLHLPERGVTANADPALLERIVENLLANALKYTPEGTPIWVDADRHDGGVRLVVEDAGPGIPPHARETVFEPFQRLDPDHPSPGAGLGLTLVAELAQLHGGHASAGERDGGGARFAVWLPDRAATDLERGAPIEAGAAAQPSIAS